MTMGSARTIERRVGFVLGVATAASVLLLIVGVAGMCLTGADPLARAFPVFSLAAIPRDLAHLATPGFLWLGLIAVILTPSVRVVAALAGFAATGERRMTLVAVAVLAVICMGAVLGAGG